jgi:arylsulfatase A-like enzyme
MSQPNIIFIFSDQQRWDTVGCYGENIADCTPHLDKLAAEGVRFHHAFTNQPVCGPTRAVLQTGKYATETGVFTNHRLLPLQEETLAKRLRKAGYETAYIGKWHLASTGERNGPDDFREKPVPPERRGGYDDFWLASDTLEYTSHSYDGHMFDEEGKKREFPPGRYRVDVLTDWALEYLQNRKTDKPFLLFLSFLEPHHQNDHNQYEGPKGSKTRFASYNIPGDLEGTEGDWRENFPDYLGCIHSIDQNVDRIVNELRHQGILDQSIVIYTSDHGSHFRTRNDEYKRSCHEGCCRVPLIIRGGEFLGGVVSQRLVNLIDLPATLLDLAGVPIPKEWRGTPLKHALPNQDSQWQDEIFIQISESQVGRALRTPKWKYAITAPDKNGGRDSNSQDYEESYLYDLEADPHERNNLITNPAYTEIRAELSKRLLKRMKEIGEPDAEIHPAKNNIQ